MSLIEHCYGYGRSSGYVGPPDYIVEKKFGKHTSTVALRLRVMRPAVPISSAPP
jgi:hypothetical protein